MRRFTKLSLRALFVTTTVCCAVAGYVAWNVQRFQEQARLLRTLDQRLGGDDGCEYTLVPARPAWLWNALVGKDAGEIVKARFYRVWEQGDPAVGVRAGEMIIVGRWTSLKSLFVAGDGITDDSIPPLQRMHQLESVAFVDTPITSEGIAQLRGHPSLREVAIRTTEYMAAKHPTDRAISAEAIAALATIPNLSWLNIEGYRIDDAGVAVIASLNRLPHLELTEADISDADLAVLAQLPSLEGLSLSRNPAITDAGMKHLDPRWKLRWLHIIDTGITANGLWVVTESFPQFTPDTPVWGQMFHASSLLMEDFCRQWEVRKLGGQ